MWYEINVSLNGKHLFATDQRSIACRADLERVLPILKQKFQEEEGFKVSVIEWKTIGKSIDALSENGALEK